MLFPPFIEYWSQKAVAAVLIDNNNHPYTGKEISWNLPECEFVVPAIILLMTHVPVGRSKV